MNFSALGKWQIHPHLPTHGSQKYLSSCFHDFAQERDAERRRQLRERARQLIAEARSGVKMSEMSLLDTSAAERGKSSRTGPVAGQHTHLWRLTDILLVSFYTGVTRVYYLYHTKWGKVTGAQVSHWLTFFIHTFPLCSLKVFFIILRGNQDVIWHQPRLCNPPPSHLQQQFTRWFPSRLIPAVIVNQQKHIVRPNYAQNAKPV